LNRTTTEPRYGILARKPETEIANMRTKLGDILNGLGAKLMDRMLASSAVGNDTADVDKETAQLKLMIARLGTVASGLSLVDSTSMPERGAGYGSEVEVRNIDSGSMQTYTLLIGSLMDVEANHVSLASPIGQALLGRQAGEEVVISTPQRHVRLRVVAVRTLQQFLQSAAEDYLDE
jgi:transcription elongation GreA/GreB family factor